jgi:hypothetical protein
MPVQNIIIAKAADGLGGGFPALRCACPPPFGSVLVPIIF